MGGDAKCQKWHYASPIGDGLSAFDYCCCPLPLGFLLISVYSDSFRFCCCTRHLEKLLSFLTIYCVKFVVVVVVNVAFYPYSSYIVLLLFSCSCLIIVFLILKTILSFIRLHATAASINCRLQGCRFAGSCLFIERYTFFYQIYNTNLCGN